MRTPLFPEGASATFADYFRLNADLDEILATFDCSYRLENCKLRRSSLNAQRVAALKVHLEESLPHISLNSETARREFLIAPVLTEVAMQADARIKVEMPLEVDDLLKGTLDYFLKAHHNMLVVEAKNADLQRGFTQLAVELVALDRWVEDDDSPRLYGAVSIGDVWKIGYLERAEKLIVEDLNTFSVPTDLPEILGILVSVLTE